MNKVLFLVLAICISSVHSHANAGTDINSLLTVKTLKCHLDQGISTETQGDEVIIDKARWSKDPEKSVMVFDSINIKDGLARMIGNQGATDLVVLANMSGITLIEETVGGVV